MELKDSYIHFGSNRKGVVKEITRNGDNLVISYADTDSTDKTITLLSSSLNSGTVGSSNTPIYLNNGVPTTITTFDAAKVYGYISFDKLSYLVSHPEALGGVVIPFINNDIAFLRLQGGNAKAYSTTSTDLTAETLTVKTLWKEGSTMDGCFDASYSYINFGNENSTEMNLDGLIIDIICPYIFRYDTTFYIDFGNSPWGYSNIEVYVRNSNSETIYTKFIDDTTKKRAVYYKKISKADEGFDNIRIHLFGRTHTGGVRIAQIGLINYSSAGQRYTSMSRGIDDKIFRSITPYTANTYSLGSSTNYWNKIYSNLFIKNGGTNLLVLLANGDVKSLSDFSIGKWSIGRSITLIGSVTGSVTGVDGSSDISIVTTTNHNHDDSYVKLDASTNEQTIISSIDYLNKGVINLWRKIGGGYSMIGFSNGTKETLLGKLGFAVANTPIFRNTSNTDYNLIHTGNISTGDNNGLIKLGGTNISVKGLGSRAYDSTDYLPLTGGTLSGALNFSSVSDITWNQDSYQQRIHITDDSSNNTPVFTFQQSSDSGSSWTDLLTILDDLTAKLGTNVVAHAGNVGTGDAVGQIKIAGVNVDVNGWSSLATTNYVSTNYLPLSGGTIVNNDFGPLFIQRNHTTNAAAIGFKHYSSGTTVEIMGYIAMQTKNGKLKRYNSDTSASYDLLESSDIVTSISSSSTDTKVPSALAVYNAITAGFAANNAMVYAGTVDGSGTAPGTMFPTSALAAGSKGKVWKVSQAGYINGVAVEVGDMIICNSDSAISVPTSSNYTTVNANFDYIQANLDPTQYVTLLGVQHIIGLKTIDVLNVGQLSVTGLAQFTNAINGDITGNATTADKLKNARSLKVNLATTAAQSFSGNTDATSIGVSGILPVANGGNVISHLYVGGTGATSNATTDTSDPYLSLVEGSTLDSQVQLKAGSGITVSAKDGIVTITNSRANTDRYVNSAAFAMDADNGIKMTLTRAGSDTNTVTGTISQIASTTGRGLTPKLALASTDTIATQASEYVLTYKSGTDTTPVWRKLPSNAYSNTTNPTWTSDSSNAAYPIGFCTTASPTSGNRYNDYYNTIFTFNPSTKAMKIDGCTQQYDSTNKCLKFIFT